MVSINRARPASQRRDLASSSSFDKASSASRAKANMSGDDQATDPELLRAGADARSALGQDAGIRGGSAALTEALIGGQQADERLAVEILELEQIMDRMAQDPGFKPAIRRAPTATAADIKSGKAPATALPPGVDATYIPSKNVILVREGLTGPALKAAVAEELGEWLGVQAEKGGVQLASGDVGARVVKVQGGEKLSAADFEARPSDTAQVRLNGKLVQGRAKATPGLPTNRIPSNIADALEGEALAKIIGPSQNYFNYARADHKIVPVGQSGASNTALMIQLLVRGEPITDKALEPLRKQGAIFILRGGKKFGLDVSKLTNAQRGRLATDIFTLQDNRLPYNTAALRGIKGNNPDFEGNTSRKNSGLILARHLGLNGKTIRNEADFRGNKNGKAENWEIIRGFEKGQLSFEPIGAVDRGFDPNAVAIKQPEPSRRVAPSVKTSQVQGPPIVKSFTISAKMLGGYKGQHTDRTRLEYKDPATGKWTLLLRRGAKDKETGPLASGQGSFTIPVPHKAGSSTGVIGQIRMINESYGVGAPNGGEFAETFDVGPKKEWNVGAHFYLKRNSDGGVMFEQLASQLEYGQLPAQHRIARAGSEMTGSPGKMSIKFHDGGNLPKYNPLGRFNTTQVSDQSTPDMQVDVKINRVAQPATKPPVSAPKPIEVNAPQRANNARADQSEMLSKRIMTTSGRTSFSPKELPFFMKKTGYSFKSPSGYKLPPNVDTSVQLLREAEITPDRLKFYLEKGIVKVDQRSKTWSIDMEQLRFQNIAPGKNPGKPMIIALGYLDNNDPSDDLAIKSQREMFGGKTDEVMFSAFRVFGSKITYESGKKVRIFVTERAAKNLSINPNEAGKMLAEKIGQLPEPVRNRIFGSVNEIIIDDDPADKAAASIIANLYHEDKQLIVTPDALGISKNQADSERFPDGTLAPKATLGILLHETAHLIEPKREAGWVQAMQKDGPDSGPSRYSVKSKLWSEDFAETFVAWHRIRTGRLTGKDAVQLEKMMQNRFDFLDNYQPTIELIPPEMRPYQPKDEL